MGGILREHAVLENDAALKAFVQVYEVYNINLFRHRLFALRGLARLETCRALVNGEY